MSKSPDWHERVAKPFKVWELNPLKTHPETDMLLWSTCRVDGVAHIVEYMLLFGKDNGAGEVGARRFGGVDWGFAEDGAEAGKKVGGGARRRKRQ